MQQHQVQDHEQYQQYTIFSKTKPQNYRPSLWKVDDSFAENPVERFVNRVESPFLEQAIEAYGAGPLETSDIPVGLINFAKDFVSKFGAVPSTYVKTEEVLRNLFSHLDYTDPYFLFIDTPVQISQKHMQYMFSFKESGSVLPTHKIESFEVVRGWDFKPYTVARDTMFHPGTQKVLAGEPVKHQTKNRPVTIEDILVRLSEICYGSHDLLNSAVGEWMFHHYDGLRYDYRNGEQEIVQDIDSIARHDELFWKVVTVAGMIWLKSPHALPYLIDIHPVYWATLRISDETGRAILAPGTDGFAVAHGWDIYTFRELDVIELQPGTCAGCEATLHCTKFVNITAIAYPTCTCQKPVDIEDTGLEDHYSSSCTFYRSTFKANNVFLCMRCLDVQLTNRDLEEHQKVGSERKCGRFECPAYNRCSHHPGMQAYVNALTSNRLKAIPDLRQR